MASSIFVPQLLIPEGELDEILRIIKKARKGVKIVGQLFGLWRNSLVQPVVHLITGPGKKSTMSKDKFTSDSSYGDRLRKFLDREHGLLHIGAWLSGSVEQYPQLDQSNREFNLRTAGSMINKEGKYFVLLFVDCTEQRSVDIKYHIIDLQGLSFPVADLAAKDVLPGNSCYRTLEHVFNRIKSGAKFPSKHYQHTHAYFSTDMLKANKQPPAPIDTATAKTATTTVIDVPERVIMPAPQTTSSSQPVRQWYESEAGQSLLRKITYRFQELGIAVDMTRDANSHDLSLEIKS